jgi:signal transduction histidine kinase
MKTLPFTGKEREIVEVMDMSIHRATELVQQVLAFSRGRRGKRETMELAPGLIIGELERSRARDLPARRAAGMCAVAPDLATVQGRPHPAFAGA